MKPEKLIISAWGPYPGQEAIDFDAFGETGVFLITGPTGGGKTTIFDTISYALYGNVSGKTRDKTSVRSDFAAQDTKTFVRLEFSHRRERYIVTRSPKYTRPKKRGDGMIAEPETAALIMPDGREYSSVNRVNEELIALLGINHEQFKQVSMIAQGEFMELLTADSQKRVEIFRNIFNTGIFNRIQLLLGERSRRLYYDIEDLHHRLEEAVSGIVCGDNALLRMKLDNQPRQYTELYEILKEEISGQKIRLQEVVSWIDKQSGYVRKLGIALENHNRIQKNVVLLAGRLQELQDKGRQLSLQKDEIIKRWENKAELDHNVEVTNVRLLQCEEHIRGCQEFNGIRKNFTTLEKHFTECSKLLEKLSKQEIQILSRIEKQQKTLVDLGDVQSSLDACLSEKREADAKAESVKAFLEQCSRCQEMKNTYGEKLNFYVSANESFLLKKQAYDQGEQKSMHAAAGLMAKELEEGQPCPVCGATHHLEYATMATDVPSADALELLRQAMEDGRSQMMDALNTTVAAKGQYEVMEKEILLRAWETGLETHEATLEKVIRLLLKQVENDHVQQEKLLARMEKLKLQAQKKAQAEIALTDLDVERAQIRQQTVVQEQAKTKAQISMESARGQMAEAKRRLLSAMPSQNQDLPDEKAFKQEKKSLEQKLRVLRSEREGLEKAYQDIFNIVSSNDALIKNEVLNLKNQEELRERAIREYEKLVEKVDIISNECTDVQLLDDLQKQLKARQNDKELLNVQIAHNTRALNSMKEKLAEEEKLLTQYGFIKDLDNAARGNNRQKLTFEQYVLGAYFDEVLAAANLRLDKMSQGRYAMQRVDRVLDYRKTNSLDIEVMDYYTGKKRSVRTLSGGESFNAALALALGLSDVIQSHAGGIEIETLFVDEGFGSLDEASLQSAVDTLMMVTGKQHLTGIISHVQELKERIEHQIVIEKKRSGSSIKAFVQ